jgi:hypothetical protein
MLGGTLVRVVAVMMNKYCMVREGDVASLCEGPRRPPALSRAVLCQLRKRPFYNSWDLGHGRLIGIVELANDTFAGLGGTVEPPAQGFCQGFRGRLTQ